MREVLRFSTTFRTQYEEDTRIFISTFKWGLGRDCTKSIPDQIGSKMYVRDLAHFNLIKYIYFHYVRISFSQINYSSAMLIIAIFIAFN